MTWRRTHDTLWRVAACTTTALGLALDALYWGFVGPLACVAFLVVVPVTSIVGLLLGKGARASARLALRSGVVLLGFCGLAVGIGWSFLLLVLALMITSPAMRVLVRARRLGAVLPEVPHHPPSVLHESAWTAALEGSMTAREQPDADGVPALDDGALCRAWSRSYVRLQATGTAEAHLEVVRFRQLCLDELLRRHPNEVRTWLESGARAAGDPLPFLR